MLEIGAFEAKNTLGSLLDRVEHGEEVIITRHGRPVARMIPNVSSGAGEKDAQEAFKRIRARAARFKSVPFDWKRIKAEREAGRA